MPGVPKRGTATRTQPPRNTSVQTKNPEPPKDPPQPVPEPAPAPDVPVPLTPEAAHQFLVGQNLLEKKQPILAGTIVNLINRIAIHPFMHPVITEALTAIALLTLSALDMSSRVIQGLDRLERRLDALEGDSKQILENTTGQEPGPQRCGQGSCQRGAAEKAVEESQKMMAALVDSQTSQPPSDWVQVTAQNRSNHRGPALPAQGAVFQGVKAAAKTQRERVHNLKFPTLPDTTLENLRAKGAKVLVQPEAGVLEKSLEGLDAKALIQKANLAFEAAWKTLSTTSFPADHNLPAGRIPQIKFITAERIPSGGVLYGLENREQALFLCNAKVAKAFDAGLGVAKLMGQRVELFLQSAPVNWDPESQEALHALEHEKV
ncbi:hypothetical protein FRC09_019935 [Ceratobasidium sp. 395]|nr:hypothetical protein FRC09_019935 [Ceratobasidium sp. 395]